MSAHIEYFTTFFTSMNPFSTAICYQLFILVCASHYAVKI